MTDADIQALLDRNDGMYLDMDGELGEYEWLDNTSHWDRRIHSSRIRVSDILYALASDDPVFKNLRCWEVQKPEAEDAIQYYRDNRDLFEEMEDDIYNVESLDGGMEVWQENKEDYDYERESPS